MEAKPTCSPSCRLMHQRSAGRPLDAGEGGGGENTACPAAGRGCVYRSAVELLGHCALVEVGARSRAAGMALKPKKNSVCSRIRHKYLNNALVGMPHRNWKCEGRKDVIKRNSTDARYSTRQRKKLYCKLCEQEYTAAASLVFVSLVKIRCCAAGKESYTYLWHHRSLFAR